MGLPDAFCKNTGHFDLLTVPDLSCVLFRKRHREKQVDNQYCLATINNLHVVWLAHYISVCM